MCIIWYYAIQSTMLKLNSLIVSVLVIQKMDETKIPVDKRRGIGLQKCPHGEFITLNS